MRIWAIADIHLAISIPEKTMEVFGPQWQDYQSRLKKNWEKTVSAEDLVLIAGDISWAKSLEMAMIDLNWIDALPGTKVLIRGNHDSWWSSQSKMEKIRPKSLIFLYKEAILWNDIALAGARLWDTEEYSFEDCVEYKESPLVHKDTRPLEQKMEDDRRIFSRELLALDGALATMPKEAKKRIALTHYPPIGPKMEESAASKILEKHKVDICVFGHLHSLKSGSVNFGKARGVEYIFCAADYCQFQPLHIL